MEWNNKRRRIVGDDGRVGSGGCGVLRVIVRILIFVLRNMGS